MAHLVCLETEDDTMLKDLSGEGFEADMRRAAVDGVISQMWDRNMKDFCSAMQIANISASQAAQVITVFTMLQGRKK